MRRRTENRSATGGVRFKQTLAGAVVSIDARSHPYRPGAAASAGVKSRESRHKAGYLNHCEIAVTNRPYFTRNGGNMR